MFYEDFNCAVEDQAEACEWFNIKTGVKQGCNMSGFLFLIAELQCAKRASEAPWVNKIGNPSSQENLVMTSAYKRANAVCTDSGGGGGASRGSPHGEDKECHLSWAGFFRKVRD